MACCDGNGKGGYTRATRLYSMLKNDNPRISLVTHHNLAYMVLLNREMREAIKQDTYANFARKFARDQFCGKENGGQDVSAWVKDALDAAVTGISLEICRLESVNWYLLLQSLTSLVTFLLCWKVRRDGALIVSESGSCLMSIFSTFINQQTQNNKP
jgi:hypothetical protein